MDDNQVDVKDDAALVAKQEQADFQAGFTGTEQPIIYPEVDKPTEIEKEIPETEPENTMVLAGLTEDQLKTLLAKASKVDQLESELHTTRDKLFGKFGEFQRNLQELRKAEPPGVESGAKRTVGKLARLAEEYPELAELLEGDLAEALGPASTTEPEEFTELVKAQVEPLRGEIMKEFEDKFELQFATKMMDHLRPDWREVINTPDFAIFKARMPSDELEKFDSTRDYTYYNGVLSRFDEWKDRSTKKTSNVKRLENAVLPRGTVSTDHAPSDADAFESGFRSVRNVTY